MHRNRWVLVALLAGLPLFAQDPAEALAKRWRPPQEPPAARDRKPAGAGSERSTDRPLDFRHAPILGRLPRKAPAWLPQVEWRVGSSWSLPSCHFVPASRFSGCG